jgi:hypothetical protein
VYRYNHDGSWAEWSDPYEEIAEEMQREYERSRMFTAAEITVQAADGGNLFYRIRTAPDKGITLHVTGSGDLYSVTRWMGGQVAAWPTAKYGDPVLIEGSAPVAESVPTVTVGADEVW